jgi:hypothetical protein
METALITLFSTAKPFIGHHGVIQRNAITSWTRLNPRPQIILCGDEPGSADIAAEYGLEHIPQIAGNDYGTPYISDMFRQVHQRAKHDLVCYVNADIILMDDLLDAVRRVRMRQERFLIAGKRHDLDITAELDFSAGWEDRLRQTAATNGAVNSSHSIDYFVFPADLLADFPPFLIGRPYWDIWFLYLIRRQKMALIDATESVLAAHQNHDYSHLRTGSDNYWQDAEFEHNSRLYSMGKRRFSLYDATHVLTSTGLQSVMTRPRRLRRYLENMPVFNPWLGLPASGLLTLMKAASKGRQLLRPIQQRS